MELSNKGVNNKRTVNKNFLMLIPIIMIMLISRPLDLNLNQSLVLGSLFMVVLWWGTGIVHKNIASVLLIVAFILFGNTSIQGILYFPLSDNLILVIASYLLSQGIVNSEIADRFASYVLKRYCNNSMKLIYMSFGLGIALIFVIPQPFPRVILLSSIYLNLLKKVELESEEKKVILFSVFVASTVTSLLFLNGDVVINNIVQGFGGVTISYVQWIKYMTIPALISTVLVAVGYGKIFKNELKSKFEWEDENRNKPISRMEKKAIGITAIVILLWLTEEHHGISAANTALLGVVLMYATNVVSLRDFKAVNTGLLLFLTAEFAIGKVLVGSGIADKLSNALISIFPNGESLFYIPFIIFLIMVLHMVMGSLVTALSVLIPTLVTICSGNLSSEVVVLLTTVSVCFHYLLPFQHVTIMLGYGNEYFDNRHVLKIGGYLTVLTFGAGLFIFVPWWKLINLM